MFITQSWSSEKNCVEFEHIHAGPTFLELFFFRVTAIKYTNMLMFF